MKFSDRRYVYMAVSLWQRGSWTSATDLPGALLDNHLNPCLGTRASCAWPARLADRRASDHEDRAVNRHARHEVDVLGLCFANLSLDEHHDVVLIGPL